MGIALFEVRYDLSNYQGVYVLTQPQLDYINTYRNQTEEQIKYMEVQYPWYWKEVLVRVE